MIRKNISGYIEPFQPKGKLLFCDMTLREGEQTAGVSYTMTERMELVRRLDDMGVGQIQLYNCWGGAALREGQLDICRKICEMERKQIKTEIINFYTDDLDRYREMMDIIASVHPDIIHTGYSTTPEGFNGQWTDQTPDELVERIKVAVDCIKAKGCICNISFLDATRTQPEVLAKLVQGAAQAGADRIRLTDTVGLATPEAIRTICKIATDEIGSRDIMLGMHTHNDFGLGLINMIEGIRCGATLIDSSINGLGERCGNAPFEQLVVALEVLYGIDTGVDTKKLMELCKYVEKISGVPIPNNAPLTGKFAFSDGTEKHIVSSFYNPFAYQGIIPEDIGGKRVSIFGKGMSDNVIRLTAQKQGRAIAPELYPKITQALYDRASTEKGKVFLDENFWEIVDELEQAN